MNGLDLLTLTKIDSLDKWKQAKYTITSGTAIYDVEIEAVGSLDNEGDWNFPTYSAGRNTSDRYYKIIKFLLNIIFEVQQKSPKFHEMAKFTSLFLMSYLDE